MAVEKINAIESLNITPAIEQRAESEEKTVPQSKGNVKDIITVLSILSAIGAAGVAIYKHNNAKKMVEEAEKAAKKKVEEAEQKVKKAEEENENKIREAVRKVVNEYEKIDKKVNDVLKTTKNEKKNIETKKSEKPKKQNNTEESEKNLEGGIYDDSLEIVKPSFFKRIKNKINRISVNFSTTKLSEFFVKIKSPFKDRINRTKSKKRTVNTFENAEKTKLKDSIKDFWSSFKAKFKRKSNTEDTAVSSAEKTSNLKIYSEKIVETTKQAKEFFVKKWNRFLSFFKHKDTETPALKITEEGEKIRRNIKEQLNGKTDYEKLANALITEPRTQTEHDRLQALYNTLAVKEPKLSEIFKGITIPDAAQMAEKDLITEYNALSEIVKSMSAEDAATVRYLEITGELLNHRGYKIQPNGQIKKVITEKERAVINSLPLKEVSDLDLLIEYNLLRKRVQKLPVSAPESQRFLEIQGELLNHRGYKIQSDNKVKKVSKDNNSIIGQIKRFFSF